MRRTPTSAPHAQRSSRDHLTGSLGTASSALGGLFGGGTSRVVGSCRRSRSRSSTPARYQANLDVAKVQKDIGIAQYEKAIQVAFREVSDGLAARGTYDDEVAATSATRPSQQRALELSGFRYRKRSGQLPHRAHGADRLLRRAAHVDRRALQRLTSLVDLYRALGGGWEEREGRVGPPGLEPGTKGL